MKKLILFPFGGNAREAVSVVDAINRIKPTWEILGFADDDVKTHGLAFLGHRVLGGKDILKAHPDAFVLAVPGGPTSFHKRDTLLQSLEVHPTRWATIIHPSASLGGAVNIGKNTLIMAGVVMTASVNVGDHCVVLPNTVLSHDTNLLEGSMVGSNVSVSSSTTIGPYAYLGSGTRLLQGLRVGEKSMTGLGSVVIRDVSPQTTVAGCPAKPLSHQRTL